MAELYDSEGNLVEGALTSEEAAALKTQAETASKEIEEIKGKLSKLENKDMNFKRMRDMTETELSKLTAKEVELLKRQETLEEQQRSFVETQINSYKDESLAVLAGDDEDMRKKIAFHFDRIKDEAITKADIQKKMRDAYRLAREDSRPGMDPFARAMDFSGGAPPARKDAKEPSSDVKDLASKMGISEETLKKYWN